MNINKIIVTGDFTRLSHKDQKWKYDQFKNIKWLFTLLKPVLTAAFDLPVDYWPKAEDISKYDKSFIEKIFECELNSESIDLQWAQRSDSEISSCATLGLLNDLFSGALVISLETPNFFINYCEGMNIPIVDIIFHPVRFMPDLMFGMRSSAFKTSVSKYAVSDLIIKNEAALIEAYNKRKKNVKFFNGAGNSLLILGQMDVDRSLVENGNFKALDDYIDEIKHLSRAHDSVLYKPHPYMINTTEKLNYLAGVVKKISNKIRVTSTDFYWLLAQDELSSVAAVSSGGVIEAGYFGKNTHFLKGYQWKLACDKNKSSDSYYPIMNLFMSKEFWTQSFGIGGYEERDDGFELGYWISHKNMIRKSLIQSWGFSITDLGADSFLLENDRKNSRLIAENCASLVKMLSK